MGSNRYNQRVAWLLMSLLPFMGGCGVVVDLFECEGRVEHGYDIADIVLVTNAEQFSRDLEARPEVFYQSGGERLFFEAESSNYDVADASTDEYGFLTVVAGHPGQAQVTVEARDACDGYARTTFLVDVVPYESVDVTANSR